MPRFSPEELTRKHLSTKITAKDRARDFSSDFYQDGSQSVNIQSTLFGVKLFGISSVAPT